MFKGIDDAVEIGAEVLFWDEPHFFIDWAKVASIASLDIFGTDPYWIWFAKPVAEFVGDFSRHVVRLARQFNKEPQIWIQNFKIPAGRDDAIRQAVDVAYAAGVRNFAAWSFYGTGYISYIKPDDPQKVWDTLGEVYGQISRGE